MSDGTVLLAHIKAAANILVEQSSYGLAAGSAAGYLATALKVSKALTFVNLGIAFAVGWGSYNLLRYLLTRIKYFNEDNIISKIAQNVALPALAALGAIFSVRYASLTVYTIAAVAAGAYVLGTWLTPKVVIKQTPQRQLQVAVE